MKTLLILLFGIASFSAHANELNLQEGFLFEPVLEEINPNQPTPPCIKANNCYLIESSYPNYLAVPSNQPIRLLGKGLQGKDSSQNMSIACVGENQSCETLRFIYYVNTNELYFVGPKFKIVNNDPKNLKKAMKRLSKGARAGASQNAGGITMIGLGAGSFALIPLVGAAPFVLVFGAAFFAWTQFGENGAAMPFDFVAQLRNAINQDEGMQLTNQNGWNWSSQPKRIREKTFENLVFQLQVSNGFFSNNPDTISVR